MSSPAKTITRSDLEAKLREVSGDANETVEAAKPQLIGGAVAVAILALVVALGSGVGTTSLIRGWNVAALVSAGLCTVGAVIAMCCRTRVSGGSLAPDHGVGR